MRLATQMVILGLLIGGWAWHAGGGWRWLWWLAADFVILGGVWLRGDARVFEKRADGRRGRVSTVVLLPYLMLTWALWHAVRWSGASDAVAEVRPGLLIGRRRAFWEARPAVDGVLDLTAEFTEPAAMRGAGYVSLPVLDGGTPRVDALMAALRRVDWPRRSVFVHCAQGHGRTATVTAALLIEAGACGSVDEALAAVQRVRPGARPSAAQRRFLDEWARSALERRGAAGGEQGGIERGRHAGQ